MGHGWASPSTNFHADAASPDGEGQTSIVSDPIEGLTPEEFWALFAMVLRNRHPRLLDDAHEVASEQVDDEALLVLDPGGLYSVWQLMRDADQAQCRHYGNDSSLSKAKWEATLKVHRMPFRIEFWCLVYGQRDSGKRLKDVMTRLLRTMKSQAACAHNVDSPGSDGMKCVLSDPIVDSVLSPEMFWKHTKELIKKKAEKTLPDGSILQKSKDSWDLFDSTPTYTRHVFNEDRKEIVSYTYSDIELSDASLEKVRHLRIHPKPYRLEMWMASPDQRRATDVEKEQLLELLEPVFEHAMLIGQCGQSAADTGELSRLRAEVDHLREEVSDALCTLRKGAEVLQGTTAIFQPRCRT